MIKEDFGINKVGFLDDIFNVNRKSKFRIKKKIKERGIKKKMKLKFKGRGENIKMEIEREI